MSRFALYNVTLPSLYEVGDIATFRDDLVVGNRYNEVTYAYWMYKMVGVDVTIREKVSFDNKWYYMINQCSDFIAECMFKHDIKQSDNRIGVSDAVSAFRATKLIPITNYLFKHSNEADVLGAMSVQFGGRFGKSEEAVRFLVRLYDYSYLLGFARGFDARELGMREILINSDKYEQGQLDGVNARLVVLSRRDDFYV